MRLLLDTHTLLWWDEDQLPRRVTNAIQDAAMKAPEVFWTFVVLMLV